MQNPFSRTELLLGSEAMEMLYHSRVAVFGIGGVGGYTVEALARSGIGTLDIIDDDLVCLSNLNRQIFATHQTIGQYKVDVAKERILDINPGAVVNTYKLFFSPQTAGKFPFSDFDYVVDAIDTVTGKLELAEQAKKAGVPIISCMGAGNKLDPTSFEVADIYETSVCPLARVMRRELKKRGIEKLKVVYSKEPAMTPLSGLSENDTGQQSLKSDQPDECPADTAGRHSQRRQVPASCAFVPSVAGLIIAGEVVKDLCKVRGVPR